MLFIGHDAAKVAKADVLRQQRVCADHKQRAAVCNLLQRFVPLFLLHAAFEQHDRLTEDFAKVLRVLFCQDFGRREQLAPPCLPFAAATQRAYIATAVLPEPTSLQRRFIGTGLRISIQSHPVRAFAPVAVKTKVDS